jgi:hypothetical protein
MQHQHLMYHYQLLHTVFFIHYSHAISSVLVFTHYSLRQKKCYIVNRGPLAISTCLLFLPPSVRCTFLKRCNTNPCNTCWPYHSLNTNISVLSAPATQCRLDVRLDPEREGHTTSNLPRNTNVLTQYSELGAACLHRFLIATQTGPPPKTSHLQAILSRSSSKPHRHQCS